MNPSSRRNAATGFVACVAVMAGALSASEAAAAEAAAIDPVAELTQPKSSVEVGVGGVSDDSYKFGEYNGLQRKGVFGVGGFDLRGTEAYDSTNATRWRIRGSNLGLDTRSAGAEYGVQGKFRLTLGFDELRRNRSDSYSTPYLGAGSSVLALPSSWIVPVVPRLSATAANARGLSPAVANSSAIVSGVSGAPSVSQLASSNALLAADLPLFTQHNIHTTRSRYEAGLKYLLSSNWDVAVNARREDREGAKLMGSVARTTGADISAPLVDPIDQTTGQFNATIGYHHKTSFIQLGYYGSTFSNNVSSLTWTNWAAPASTMTMSSAPDNQAHQLLLSAGHDLTPTLRLVANAAYSRNTQNALFLQDASTPLVPVASLDGLVVTRNFGLKLTSRPRRQLNLSVGYKFDERDNRTPVRTFAYYDANEVPAATNINAAFSAALGVPAALLRSNANVNASRPYSRKLNQADAAADLRLTPTQSLRAGYQWQHLQRWCDGSWIDCADAASTKESEASLEWRVNPRANLNARLAYTWSQRNVDDYNENAFLALVPLANVSPTTATGGASAYSFMVQNGWTGYGPVAGYAATTGNMNLFFPLNNALANALYANQNRISELIGMRRYNMADRRRDRVRASADWQPAETFSLQANVDYRADDYSNSRYGLISARDWSASLDGTWNPNERVAVSLFITFEDQRARSAGNTYTANSAALNVGGFTAISGGCFATVALRNASNKIDPCLDWTTTMRDRSRLIGLSLDRKHLLSGKLDVGAQLVVSRSDSDNSPTGGNYVNNPLAVAGAPAGTIAAYYIPATPLPSITADSVELRLNGRYALSNASWMRLAYVYGNLSSGNYAYDGMQPGGLAGVLPSYETSPRYTVHVVALSYVHRF